VLIDQESGSAGSWRSDMDNHSAERIGKTRDRVSV